MVALKETRANLAQYDHIVPPKITERDWLIYRGFMDGSTVADISQAHSLSRQRISQVVIHVANAVITESHSITWLEQGGAAIRDAWLADQELNRCSRLYSNGEPVRQCCNRAWIEGEGPRLCQKHQAIFKRESKIA